MKGSTISKRFWVILLVITILALGVRLYKLSTPLADWHSFRQADTASVTREYVKHGVDLLHPRYHDLSDIQSGWNTGGKDNVEGWRMVEFPLINGIIAMVLRAFPTLDLVTTSRLFSVAVSLVTLIALAVLARELFSAKVGLISAAVFGFLPYSIFYSRVILPEPYLVMFSTVSLFCFLSALEKNRVRITWLMLSYGLFALALLIKPMAIFVLPAFAGVVLVRQGIRGFLNPLLYLGVLAFIPVYLWRQWIVQFPSGIPASDWLYNQNNIRLKPAWFRWLFAERIGKLMLGYWGTVFFVSGIIALAKKKFVFPSQIVVWLWGVGMLAYLVVFATGNVQHDYYQALLVPFVSLVVGQGILWILSIREQTNSLFVRGTVASVVAISLLFSWYEVKGYYSINHPEIVEAGKAADRLLPPDAKVIAAYMGDTAFLFQTNRTGWPIGFNMDKKIANGAQYYVSVNYDDETNELLKKYPSIEKNEKYVILDLTRKLEQERQ